MIGQRVRQVSHNPTLRPLTNSITPCAYNECVPDSINGTDGDFISNIAPNVLKVLAEIRFFEALDDQMCPVGVQDERAACTGSFSISTGLLSHGGLDENDIAEILEVLGTNGGHCDCEILFNVAENSRLKSEYWRARAEGRLLPQPHRK